MINFLLICKSNHWPVRLKKVNAIVKNIIKFKKDINIYLNIYYICNNILIDNNI